MGLGQPVAPGSSTGILAANRVNGMGRPIVRLVAAAALVVGVAVGLAGCGGSGSAGHTGAAAPTTTTTAATLSPGSSLPPVTSSSSSPSGSAPAAAGDHGPQQFHLPSGN